MDTAYFSKITGTMSWNSLNKRISKQIYTQNKALPYKIIIQLSITSKDFNEISKSLKIPHKCYLSYSHLSIPDSSGIWNCILIKSISDSRNLLLYTGGNIYPLYASIINIE